MTSRRTRIDGFLVRLRRRARDIESWTEWIYPHRSLRLTREGWFFLVVTMAIGLAALNTGHNLFYLVFAMLVSLIVVSGLLSERVVRSLRIERRMPAEIFATSAAPVEIRVRNMSSSRASYAVEVRDGVAGEPRRRIGFIDRLDSGAERSFVGLWTFARRGRQRFRSTHLVTRFPFGLFEKTRIVRGRESFVVFPAVVGDEATLAARGGEERALRKHRLGEETIGLRRKLPDDEPRRIHWRVSARIGEWMVTEQAEGLDRPLAVFFDSRGTAGEAFEAAVRRAARLVWGAAQGGRPILLYSWGACFRGDGPRAWRAALGYLAEVAPIGAEIATGEAELREWRSAAERQGGGLFVTTNETSGLPPGTLLRVA